MLSTGTVLQNRYRIVSLLKKGGMGAIYRAWHLSLNMPVAIKEMVPKPGLDAKALNQLRQQFQQEAAVLAHLSHPNLVRVIDHFEEASKVYLVMDFVEGESLGDLIEHEGALPEDEVLEWADQLLDALAYCHDQGVIHRDIKPQNVLIRSDGRAMLVDFGLVKLWNPNDPQTRTAMRGLGTPEYAPPEQYGTQPGHTSSCSDIYSLGATLYHALTGQAPMTAGDRTTALVPFPSVHDLNPQVSKKTSAAISRAMELQVPKRFGSATEMQAALKNNSRAMDSLAQVASTPEMARALSRIAVAAPLIVCILVALWIAGGSGIVRQPTALPTSTATPTPIPQPIKLPTLTLVPTSTAQPTALPTPTATPTATPQPTPTVALTFTPLPTATPECCVLGDVLTRPVDGMVMVYVPAGELMMGSEKERPLHTVELDGFWIDRTEVTNRQYEQCVAAGACEPPSDSSSHSRDAYYGNSAYDDYPMVNVDWHQAAAYCTWAGGRLPTEAEWEYAASGPEKQIYPWGNEYDGTRLNICDASCDFDWNDETYDDGYADTAPVGSYPAGASWCGALDMAGNVWGWTADWYGAYPSAREENPTGPASGEQRVIRGGSFGDDQDRARCSFRGWLEPGIPRNYIGFRCAAPVQQSDY
jgi:formylglycine-generating enzyme required for sulfatase activity/tRNA A-37 threonylcarbamoyl transferase component Bud32